MQVRAGPEAARLLVTAERVGISAGDQRPGAEPSILLPAIDHYIRDSLAQFTRILRQPYHCAYRLLTLNSLLGSLP